MSFSVCKDFRFAGGRQGLQFRVELFNLTNELNAEQAFALAASPRLLPGLLTGEKVVVVTAPAKLREARRGGRKDDREARLLPDREKVKKADFVYVNIGTPEELDAWVADVMASLSGETRAQ